MRQNESDQLGFAIDRQTLNLIGIGALGGLGILLLMKYSQALKPALVGVLKEGYGFKEWLLAHAEGVKADIEDAAAEAKHTHQQEEELEKFLNFLTTDEEALRRAMELLQKKISGEGPKEGEGR